MKYREWIKQEIGENDLSDYNVTSNMTNYGAMQSIFLAVKNKVGLTLSQFNPLDVSTKDLQMLGELIADKYNDYDMVEETNNLLQHYFLDIFEENIIYYAQLLVNYRKDYDYATGNKRIVSRNDNINIEGHREINNDNNNKSTDYELPNKVIADNYESTPSNINKTDTKEKSTNDYDNNTTHESQVVTEYKNEFLDLKNKYMNQIRDVLKEFASKFELCFQLVYDWR